jgi:hypothetical protein
MIKPNDLFLSPAQVAALRNGNSKKSAGQRIPRSSEPFAKVPESHFVLLASCKSSAAFAIYLVLYRIWCEDRQKHNPVTLNMGWLYALGYAPRTIFRALNSLAAVGLVQATRKHGNSPRVFLTWVG